MSEKKVRAKSFAIGDYVQISLLSSAHNRNLGQIVRLDGNLATIEMSPFRAEILAEIMEVHITFLKFVAPSVDIKVKEFQKRITLWKSKVFAIAPELALFDAKLKGVSV